MRHRLWLEGPFKGMMFGGPSFSWHQAAVRDLLSMEDDIHHLQNLTHSLCMQHQVICYTGVAAHDITKSQGTRGLAC
jgi:hypothetical protein